MNNRPTTETDAFAIKFKTLCGEKYWVPVDIARKLERERDEAWEKLKPLRQSLLDSQDEVLRLTFENRKISQELDEAMHTIMKIEEIFIDSEDMHDDWFKMGSIAKEYFKK